jgi:hypothetical protein
MVAFGGRTLVSEDIPELSGSSEGSTSDDELSRVHTLEGKLVEAARISEETMRPLRENGRAGGLGIVSGAGSKAPTPAMFEKSKS